MNDQNHGYGGNPGASGPGGPDGAPGGGGYGGSGDPYSQGGGRTNPYANPQSQYGREGTYGAADAPGGAGSQGPGPGYGGAPGAGGDAETRAYGAYGSQGGPGGPNGPGGPGGPGGPNGPAGPGGPGGPGGPNGPAGPGGPGGPNGPNGPNGPYGSGGYEGPSSSGSSGSGGGNNKGLLIGIGALVAIVVLALGAFMFMGGDDDVENTGTETTAEGTETNGGETTDATTTGNDETTSPEATSTTPAASAAGDGSMGEPYASVVPAYLRDNADACRDATATITSYDSNVEDRTVPGLRCRGASGSLLDGNNIEIINDAEFAKGATDQARTMDYEVIKEEGGVTLIAAAYDSGSAKVFWTDTNEGISFEMYPYDNLEEAKTVAEQMK
ncbi:hypothetical protein [Corynebacterium xerosis]|uniref:hypothetical protein n=1 Tax=Corynebacterium xerosis TaxID=1725 RepID=UPI0027BA71ED|nr:hypothetical protein [Corynebacterium xerosis]